MLNAITERLKFINAAIVPYNPKIVAVTKYFDEKIFKEYFEAGLRDFGENRVSDALEKISKIPDNIRQNSNFHFIGHLQTNKVKDAVGIFCLIHSVDSLKLADVINNTAKNKGIIQHILLQINNAHEKQKFGFEPDELYMALPEMLKMENIKIAGLMNIAPLSQDEDYLRNLFKDVKNFKDKLELDFNIQLKELSMGMSNDYRIAVSQGSTMIRLGRILFQ